MKRAPTRYKFDYEHELVPLLVEKMCELHRDRGGKSKSAGKQWWFCEPFLSSPTGNGASSASLALHETILGCQWDLVIRVGFDNGVPPTLKNVVTVVDVVEDDREARNFENSVFQYAFPHLNVRVLRLASHTRLEDMALQLLGLLCGASTIELAKPCPLPPTWFSWKRAQQFDFNSHRGTWRTIMAEVFSPEYIARHGNIVCGIGFVDAVDVINHIEKRVMPRQKKRLMIQSLKKHFDTL